MAVREQLRQQLTAAEQARIQLNQRVDELQVVVKERDELRQQLVTCTSQRDSAQNQFDQLRKGIQALLNQAEAAGAVSPPPAISAIERQNQGKS